MFKRILSLTSRLTRRSIFLLGPRQTGKSTYLRTSFNGAKYYDLLEADTFRALSFKPESIREQLREQDTLIVVDEIQKLPTLLDEIHLLIERNKDLRFILTGSSARKLKRSGTNLLGGRALTLRFFPLVFPETGAALLAQRLQFGGLPGLLTLPPKEAWEDLNNYVGTYLQEEIRAEGLTRSIESFSRFLTVAGQANSQQLNYTKIGSDAQVPPRTVREFFSVLEDTLVGTQLLPFKEGKKRKPVSTSKFYFFDVGVAHALQGLQHLSQGSVDYGVAVEHLIFTELQAYLSYNQIDLPLTYWRTTSNIEVDFVIGDKIAIEVKARGRIAESDCSGLRRLNEEVNLKLKIVVSSEATSWTTADGIRILPLSKFLEELWDGRIVSNSVP